MLEYPPPFLNKMQNIINKTGYSGAEVAFLSDFEHLRGRHKRELFPDAKYIQARNEQQEKFKNEAVRRFEDALRPWEAYGLRREEWTYETLQGLFPEAWLFVPCASRRGNGRLLLWDMRRDHPLQIGVKSGVPISSLHMRCADSSEFSLLACLWSKSANDFKCLGWSGRRESNPRMKLGKLPFYH